MDRRAFLKRLGWGTGAAALGGGALLGALGGTAGMSSAGASTGTDPARPSGGDKRRVKAGDGIVVLVELGGGNDGLDTVVPIADPAYAALRGDLARDPGELADLGDGFGLAPELAGLFGLWGAGQLAVVHGVHHASDADLSHFASMAAAWAGSDDPAVRSGWAGRAADRMGSPGDLLAVAVGGSAPVLVGETSLPATAPTDPSELFGSPADTDSDPAMLAACEALWGEHAGDTLAAAVARRAQRRSLEVGRRLGAVLGEVEGDSELAQSLSVVAALITAEAGARVFHVVHPGDFDVHEGQRGRQGDLLGELDAAVTGFFDRLGPAGERVVLTTYSEFGRRPESNGSGTDHGTASVAFVAGPAVRGGHHGQPPDLGRLDDDGNPAPTVAGSDVAATLVAWLGVDPADVFPQPVSPLGFL